MVFLCSFIYRRNNNFVTNPTGFVAIIKYIVFAVFIIAAVVFWFVKKPKKESKESYV